jgi:hypothetical protein
LRGSSQREEKSRSQRLRLEKGASAQRRIFNSVLAVVVSGLEGLTNVSSSQEKVVAVKRIKRRLRTDV